MAAPVCPGKFQSSRQFLGGKHLAIDAGATTCVFLFYVLKILPFFFVIMAFPPALAFSVSLHRNFNNSVCNTCSAFYCIPHHLSGIFDLTYRCLKVISYLFLSYLSTSETLLAIRFSSLPGLTFIHMHCL